MKTRFTQAAIDRQTALDYIIAHPGATAPEIVAAMGWQKSMGADRLRDMTDHGELTRRSVITEIINKHGFPARLRTYAYTAFVTKTRTEADVKKCLATNLGNTKEKSPDRDPTFAPQVRDPNRKPIRNQGGQGACRHEVRRGCSLS